jgi:hypothetical protein
MIIIFHNICNVLAPVVSAGMKFSSQIHFNENLGGNDAKTSLFN